MANLIHAGIHWIPKSKASLDPRCSEMPYYDKVATIPLRVGADPISVQAKEHFLHKPYGYGKRMVIAL